MQQFTEQQYRDVMFRFTGIKTYAKTTKEIICVNFEMATRLHETEIVVDSLYWWYENKYPNNIEYELYPRGTQEMRDEDWHFIKKYPAPTTEELLPIYIQILEKANIKYHNATVMIGVLALETRDGQKFCELLAREILKGTHND